MFPYVQQFETLVGVIFLFLFKKKIYDKEKILFFLNNFFYNLMKQIGFSVR